MQLFNPYPRLSVMLASHFLLERTPDEIEANLACECGSPACAYEHALSFAYGSMNLGMLADILEELG